mmetsp:Transcript_25368/g.33111  ORF Transcript_25368/g.33111 Transcript_25368/m.33111 type:complete len:92 (+) Transcript_25368:964-1239(+)
MCVCFLPVEGSIVVRSVRVILRLDRIRVVVDKVTPFCSMVREPVHAADRGGLFGIFWYRDVLLLWLFVNEEDTSAVSFEIKEGGGDDAVVV